MGFPPHSLADRLDRLSIPEPNSGCHLWLGPTSQYGYGGLVLSAGLTGDVRRYRGAHVIAWELKFGPLPVGHEIDHKCNTPCCVNPDHLRPLTKRENHARSNSVSGINARKTACKRGHLLDPTNVYYPPGRLRRVCRTCRAAQRKRRL